MVKIYKLYDPRFPDDVKYVGKTKKSLNERLSAHLSNYFLESKTHKNNWVKSLLCDDIKPLISLIEEVSEEDWIQKEIFWIKYYRDLGYNLTNSTDGGEGMLNITDDIREKLSKANSGINNPNYGKKRSKETNDKINEVRVIKHSEETKKIISEKLSGIPRSEETKKKISDSNKGKIVSEETKKKLSDANKGKIISDETKEKLSESCYGEKNGFFGKKHSEETKDSISKSHKGKKHSDETREKMSQSMSGEKNGFFGKKHSEETKLKMAETRRRKKEEKEMLNKINIEINENDSQ